MSEPSKESLLAAWQAMSHEERNSFLEESGIAAAAGRQVAGTETYADLANPQLYAAFRTRRGPAARVAQATPSELVVPTIERPQPSGAQANYGPALGAQRFPDQYGPANYGPTPGAQRYPDQYGGYQANYGPAQEFQRFPDNRSSFTYRNYAMSAMEEELSRLHRRVAELSVQGQLRPEQQAGPSGSNTREAWNTQNPDRIFGPSGTRDIAELRRRFAGVLKTVALTDDELRRAPSSWLASKLLAGKTVDPRSGRMYSVMAPKVRTEQYVLVHENLNAAKKAVGTTLAKLKAVLGREGQAVDCPDLEDEDGLQAFYESLDSTAELNAWKAYISAMQKKAACVAAIAEHRRNHPSEYSADPWVAKKN